MYHNDLQLIKNRIKLTKIRTIDYHRQNKKCEIRT